MLFSVVNPILLVMQWMAVICYHSNNTFNSFLCISRFKSSLVLNLLPVNQISFCVIGNIVTWLLPHITWLTLGIRSKSILLWVRIMKFKENPRILCLRLVSSNKVISYLSWLISLPRNIISTRFFRSMKEN